MNVSKNILVITYWSFSSSILQSYALPYIRIIKKHAGPEGKIFLFTLTPRSDKAEGRFEKIKQTYASEGITLVNFNYRPFGLLMGLNFFYVLVSLIAFAIRERVSHVHAWCTPGGAIGYIVSVLTRKPLILDSFEPHAESMVETRTWRKNSLAFKILYRLEKLQLKRAATVICAAEGMIGYSRQQYGVVKDHYYVKPACVDLDLFSPRKKNYSLVQGIGSDSLVCVYIGKFGGIYLTQEVFDFFKVASGYWGEKFRVLLLTNHSDEEVYGLCDRSQLDRRVIVKHFADHREVPDYLALGHFGICPVKPVPSKKFCTPIKNAEYWAMGLPVVITKDISTDSDLISEQNIGYRLKDLDATEYLNAVKKIDELIRDPAIGGKIRKIAEEYRNYSIAENIYSDIYKC